MRWTSGGLESLSLRLTEIQGVDIAHCFQTYHQEFVA